MHAINRLKYVLPLSLALLLPMAPALAQADRPIAADLSIQEQQGVRYVSGGVGQDEREALRALENDFNLRLTFALDSGSYLAGIEVRIADGDGQPVLTATSDGPIFLAALPAGRYTVAATAEGETRESSVQLGADGQRELIFRWPAG